MGNKFCYFKSNLYEFILFNYTVTYNVPAFVQNAVRNPPTGPYAAYSTVTYQCNEGYEIQGSQSLTCDPNGKWSGPGPTCTRTGKDFPSFTLLDDIRRRLTHGTAPTLLVLVRVSEAVYHGYAYMCEPF